jgi:hypothetical protein
MPADIACWALESLRASALQVAACIHIFSCAIDIHAMQLCCIGFLHIVVGAFVSVASCDKLAAREPIVISADVSGAVCIICIENEFMLEWALEGGTFSNLSTANPVVSV